ncbi:MAG TPA: hypothetical protein ACFYEK_08380 [Candidatus Wunengus sp. YC60]
MIYSEKKEASGAFANYDTETGGTSVQMRNNMHELQGFKSKDKMS